MVLALTALLAMVGLVIDGGNAFAQQRLAQNWTDSAAEAGATQLMRRLVGVPGTDVEWDARVVAAVNESNSADPDDLTSIGPVTYTDYTGVELGPAGTGIIPANAAGVRVVGSREFTTYVSGVVGINRFTATTDATAVAGYAQTTAFGGLLPVTFPVLFTRCDGNSLYIDGNKWPVGPSNQVVVPMCSNGPGNVGWLDWTPTAGGASELATAIAGAKSPPIIWPKWYYITATGSISAGPVQAAMESHIGTDVYLPIFYTNSPSDPVPGTCNSEPAEPKTQLANCPTANRGGNGSNQWYYIVTIASFHLEEVYLNGGDGGACDPGDIAGKNISGCLIGYFTDDVAIGSGSVGGGGGSGSTSFTPPLVQLIK
jgi:hypothetical protein